VLFCGWQTVQGQGLAAGVRSDGDAILDGRGLQVVKAGARIEVQVRMDRIGDQQAMSFQYPHDAATEGVEQLAVL
jgi:hypothetical protein